MLNRQKPWRAELLKDVTIKVSFVEADRTGKESITKKDVTSTLSKGVLCFKTKAKALAWCDLMNADFPGCAIFLGDARK